MQKYTKIQASVQHGLYLFTCEIHSFNSMSLDQLIGSNPLSMSRRVEGARRIREESEKN